MEDRKMKRTILLFLTVIIILSLCAISYAEKGKHVAKDGAQMQTDTPATPTRMPPENETTILLDFDDNEGETPEMQMMIDETPVTVTWEENESVAALKELAQNGLTIQMNAPRDPLCVLMIRQVIQSDRCENIHDNRIRFGCNHAVRFVRRERGCVTGFAQSLAPVRHNDLRGSPDYIRHLDMVMVVKGNHMAGVRKRPLHHHNFRRISNNPALKGFLSVPELLIIWKKLTEHRNHVLT